MLIALLLATIAASHSIVLTWVPSSVPPASYHIYKAGPVEKVWHAYATVPLSACSAAKCTFLDTSVTANSRYQYFVTAVDNTGTESLPSNGATATVP